MEKRVVQARKEMFAIGTTAWYPWQRLYSPEGKSMQKLFRGAEAFPVPLQSSMPRLYNNVRNRFILRVHRVFIKLDY